MLRSLVRFLGQLWRSASKPAPSRKPRRRVALQVEQLETRWVPASISGYVFNDVAGNGYTLTQGDVGIQGNTIQLQDSNGNVLANTQTGSDGSYLFNTNQNINTNPQTQTQTYQFQNATTGSTQNNSSTITPFDTSLGQLESVTIIDNANLTSDIKVENMDQGAATITGQVAGTINLAVNGKTLSTSVSGPAESFNAKAYDQTLDFGGTSGHDFGNQTATGSSSITFNNATDLALFENGPINLSETATSTSSASGSGNLVAQITSEGGSNVTVIYNYVPSNALPAGQYKIVEVSTPPSYNPGPWTPTNGQQLKTTTSQEEIDVTLNNSTSTSTNNNFSFTQPVSITGTVYDDANDDGIQESNEPSLNGQNTPDTITLTGTTKNGTPVNEQTGIDANGNYSFSGLTPGTYNLSSTTPTGYFAGVANHAEVPTATSTGTAYTGITLNSGAQGSSFNFGVYQGGSLSGHVFLDNGTAGVVPLSDVQVSLIGASTGKTVATTTTGTDGSYSFSNLPPGDYTILKSAPSSPLEDEKKVPGSLGVETRGATATADEFFVGLATQQSGINYDFYLDQEIPPPPPPPPPTIIAQPPPPPSKYWFFYG